MYVMATLEDGTKVVSEFQKLKGIRGYSNEVLGGNKAFSMWRIVATQHPVSGEKVIMRNREVIPGNKVSRLAIVRPQTEEEASATTAAKKTALAKKIAELDASVFVLEATPKSVGFGIWRAGKNTKGIPVGTAFPIHRDSRYGEKYVIIDAAKEGDEGKLYFERAPELPADGDEQASDSPALVGSEEAEDHDE